MKKVFWHISFLLLCSLGLAQSPYTYSGGQYVFQQDADEIEWHYQVADFSIAPPNWDYDKYKITYNFSFNTKNNSHLFDIGQQCEYLNNLGLADASNCYSDTVHVSINFAFYDTSDAECNTPISECDLSKNLENPFIYSKFKNCNASLDTLYCITPEGDTILIQFRLIRYTDIAITSFYKSNNTFYSYDYHFNASNFCIGDSLWVLFGNGAIDTSTFKIYKQYNNNEPYLISNSILSGAISEIAYSDSFYCDTLGTTLGYRLNDVTDTIYDPSYEFDNVFTKITYYLCLQTECGQDSFFTIDHIIYVYKPLKFVPYKIFHNCTTDSSGFLILSMLDRHGGFLLNSYSVISSCPPHSGAVECVDVLCGNTFSGGFHYSLNRDNIFNETYDNVCYDLYKEGDLCSSCEYDTIDHLAEGDYEITIDPFSTCTEIPEDSVVYHMTSLFSLPNCCSEKYSCTGDPITFTFTVKKYSRSQPLGPDRILCQDSIVTLSIPQYYTEDGNHAVWGTVYCGESDSVPEHPYLHTVKNGGGGYHTITITTVEGCLIRDTVIVADLKPDVLNYKLPTALATSAVQYSSGWSTQFNTIHWGDEEDIEYFAEANSYFTGSAGIFRPEKNHDYLDTLNSTTNLYSAYAAMYPSSALQNLNIRTSGNIIDYKFFNYGNPLFTDCVPEWIKNNTMTKYSPSGYDIENKDILDIHSGALYGYNDKLPIAVCSNAKEDEMGFESFEEYSPEEEDINFFDSITQLNNSTGNIDVVSHTRSLLMPKSKDYDIVRAFNRYAMIKGNICTACDVPFLCRVTALSVPYDYTTEKIIDHSVTSYQTMAMASPCGDTSFTILKLDEDLPSQQQAFRCSFWAGKASVIQYRFVPPLGPFDVELDNTISHTGKYSLKLPNDERVILPQVDLELQPRKTYYVGAWIHHNGMDEESPENLKYSNARDSVGILVLLPNNEKVFLLPSGEVINGWQRLEGTFTMPPGNRTEIRLGFVGKREFNVDDIRIYPKNSSIQTYVYDPQNYKVRAVLDQNNYATIYSYDDEGNLFAIKKETVQGIKTIQVSSSYIKSNRE